MAAAGFEVALGHQIAGGKHGGVEPVFMFGFARVDAEGENQFVYDGLADKVGIRLRHPIFVFREFVDHSVISFVMFYC